MKKDDIFKRWIGGLKFSYKYHAYGFGIASYDNAIMIGDRISPVCLFYYFADCIGKSLPTDESCLKYSLEDIEDIFWDYIKDNCSERTKNRFQLVRNSKRILSWEIVFKDGSNEYGCIHPYNSTCFDHYDYKKINVLDYETREVLLTFKGSKDDLKRRDNYFEKYDEYLELFTNNVDKSLWDEEIWESVRNERRNK